MFKVSTAIAGPSVVSGNFPSLPFKTTKKFGCFSIVNVEVDVDIPELGIFVDFLSEVELFFEFFPFLGGVIAFCVQSAYDDLTRGLIISLNQDLSADDLVVVKDLSG